MLRFIAAIILLALLIVIQPHVRRMEISPEGDQTLLQFRYSSWQNGAFVIDPFGCMSSFLEINHREIALNASDPVCRALTQNLKSYLATGENQIVVKSWPGGYWNKNYPAQIYPRFFGVHWLSSLACAGLFVLAAMFLLTLMRSWGLSRATGLFMIAGLVYYLSSLYWWPNSRYTNDLPGHIDYTRHMAHHLSHWSYFGAEFFHSPLYYVLAARAYNVAELLRVFNPLTTVRLLSLTLYTVFVVFGLRTINESRTMNPVTRAVGTLQIIFWPAGILMATRINNDIGLYAMWGATFYYLTLWHTSRRVKDLAWAIGFSGAAFMMKSSALVPMGMIGACVLFALLTKAVTPAYFRSRPLVTAAGFFVLSLLVNFSRTMVRGPSGAYLGGGGGDIYLTLRHCFSFDVGQFLASPLPRMTRAELPFMNYVFHSALYGEYAYNPNIFDGLTNMLFLLNSGLFIFLFVRLLWNHQQRHILFPAVVGVILPLLALLAFVPIKRWAVCQDFRYVLPMIVPYAVIHTSGLEWLRSRQWRVFYWSAVVIGIAMPAAGVLFYLTS